MHPLFVRRANILEPFLQDMSVAILTTLQDEEASMRAQDQTVVMKVDKVLHDILDLATAVFYLFGNLYALNIIQNQKR